MSTIKNFKPLLNSLLTILFCGHCTLTMADDTEVYTKSITSVSSVPNILFVLDESGSMAWQKNSTSNAAKTLADPSRMMELQKALRTIISTVDNVNIGIMTFTGRTADPSHTTSPIRYPVSAINNSALIHEPWLNSQATDPVILTGNDDGNEETVSGIIDLSNNFLYLGKYPDVFTTVKHKIVTNTDDSHQSATNTNNPDANTLDLNTNLAILHSWIGLRFDNVNLPKNAIINDATIQLHVSNTPTTDSWSTIYTQNSPNNSSFTNNSNNISSRSKSATTTSWIAKSAEINPTAKTISTPSITTQIQELVNHSSWGGSSGDYRDIVVLMQAANLGASDWKFTSRNGDSTSGKTRTAEISIEHLTTRNKSHETGLRYANVGIPQGATITSAKLVFTAAATSTDSMNISIRGEDIGTAPALTTAPANISGRNKTPQKTDWILPSGTSNQWVDNNTYDSPEIKDIVQFIIDGPNWCAGNALAFIISANENSNRRIHSYNSSDGKAPRLEIEYDPSALIPSGPNPRRGETLENTGCVNLTYSARVNNITNDTEENSLGVLDPAGIEPDSHTLSFVERKIGMRFQGVTIPKDSIIQSATLTFKAQSDANNTNTGITFKGQLGANAPAFLASNPNVTTRLADSGTAAAVVWGISSDWIKTVNYTTPDLKTILQEIVNQPDWISGSNAVLLATATGQIRHAYAYEGSIADAPRLDISAKFNSAGKSSTVIRTVRSRLLDLVEELAPISSTPLVDTLYEAALYYRGNNVDYGLTRHGISAYRVSHPASHSKGDTHTLPTNCKVNNLGASACSSEVIASPATYKSPITDPCGTNHIVLLTDGEATLLKSESKVKTLIGKSTCIATTESKEACGRDLSQFLFNNDQLPDDSTKDYTVGAQRVVTHTIGFALPNTTTGNSAKAFLQDLAFPKTGDTVVGRFYAAADADGLIAAFESIIGESSAAPSSFTAPALSINAFNQLYNNNDIYFSLFTPSPKPFWDGNIKHFKLCPANATCTQAEIIYEDPTNTYHSAIDPATKVIKQTAKSYWNTIADGSVVTVGGAGTKILLPDNRKIYTTTSSTRPTFASPANLTDGANALTNGNTALTATHLGVVSALRTSIINWIRGYDTQDAYEGTDYRWRFGDPLHSSPVAITYGGTSTVPITKLVLGTNDGGIRMVNAFNGLEEWMFIPQDLLSRQISLRANSSTNRLYGMDGVPTVWVNDIGRDGTITKSAGDSVYLYIGMRRGGYNYYALDITPDDALGIDAATRVAEREATNKINPKLMWVIKSSDTNFKRLGQTWSRPLHTKMRVSNTPTDVLVFGGGYDSNLDNNRFGPDTPSIENAGNAIYIVNAKTGERIWSASSTTVDAVTSVADMKYAIPSDIALMDADGDGLTDRLYVGDLGGQLWRVDLGSDLATGSAGSTKVARLANVSTASTTDAANERRFFYPPDVVRVRDTVFSSTGRYDLVLIVSGNRENPLTKNVTTTDTIGVQDRAYAIRDIYTTALPDPISNYPVNTSSLLDVTSTLIFDSSHASFNTLKSGKGWFMNLSHTGAAAGEKGLSKGIVIAGKFLFSTYVPTDPALVACQYTAAGYGRAYAVNVLTGAPAFAWSTPGTVPTVPEDRFIKLPPGPPSEIVPVFQEGKISAIVGGGGGAVIVDPNAGMGRSKTFWSEDP